MINTLEQEIQPNVIDTGILDQVLVDPGVATTRATKAVFGTNVPYDTVYDAILNSRENQIRESLAYSQKAHDANDIADWINNRQTPLSPAEINAKFNAPVSPGSFFEDNYAKQYMSHLYTIPGHEIVDDNGTWQEAVKTIPEQAQKVLDIGANLGALREVINRRYEDAKAAYDNQGYFPWAVDLAKSLTQIYPEVKLRGNIPGSQFGLGLGDAIEYQRQQMLNMPHDQAVSTFNTAMDKLIADNPQMAMEFAKGMQGATISEQSINNLFTIAAPFDIAQGAGIVKDVSKAIAMDRFIKRAATEVIKAAPNAEKVPVRTAVADAVGDNAVAGQQRFQDSILNLKGTDVVKETIDGFQSALRTDRDVIVTRPGNFGAEVVNRLREAYDSSIENITNAVINVARVERIGDVLASQKVVSAAWNEIKSNYKGLSNSILQLGEPKRNPLTGGFNVDMFLGRSSGEFFASSQEARAWAELNKIPIKFFEDLQGEVSLRTTKAQIKTGAYLRSTEVPTVGKRFYIVQSVPLRETDNLIRDALLETAKSKEVNKGWLNSLGLPAYLRTPEEVLSKQDRLSRTVAIYAPAILKQVLANETRAYAVARRRGKGFDYFKNFGKGSQFERFLEMGMRKVDPETGIPGFKWVHPESFSTAFQQAFQRVPDPIEVDAYFAYQRGLAMDHAFRNLALYRNMTRVGAETHTIYAMVNGVKVPSEAFTAVTHKTLPSGRAPLLIIDDGGKKIYEAGNLLNSARGRAAAKGLEQGEYKLLEVYDRDLRPLNGWNGIGAENIRYILTKNVESRPLEFNQLPRQSGGHFVYDYDHYIKQANITLTRFGKDNLHYRYEGDRTVMPIENRALGSDIVGHLENVRQALLKGDIDGAKDLARKLPIPWEELNSWFKESIGPSGKKIPARLSLNEPFYVVPKNKLISDIPNHFEKYPDLENGTTGGSLARQFHVEFTGERDAREVFSIHDPGTRSNPLYSYEPARLADPITVLNRAMTRAVDSVWMDDYKLTSMEHWLQEAIKANALDATNEEIRAAPWHTFMNIPLKKGLNQEQKALLDAKRWQIKSFIGVPSTLDAWVHGVQQTLADATYGGSNAAIRSGALLSRWAVGATYNAPAFLRSVAYRMDIGLFSIPQFIVQSQNYATIFGIAGLQKAGQGTLGGLLHQYSRLNANAPILEALDNIAVKMGFFKPGEWKEARDALKRTSFDLISHETNSLMAPDHMATNFVKSTWGRVLGAGEIFFKGGERNTKYAAWYTAYKEFRDVKPTGRLTNADVNDVLLRAKMLAGDMDRAAKSALQMGPLAFPSQFLGYQLRQIEMFTGKRLTLLEKARLFGVNSVLYGIPIASTAPLLGLPINETIRQYGLDWGYIDGENKVAEAAMDGVPAAIAHMITGERYNIGQRLGPSSFDIYRDTLQADKSFWSVMSGPTGAMVTQAFETLNPFFAWGASYLRGTDTKYNPTIDSMLGILKTSASANNLLRFGHAIATGDWITRNEQLVRKGDVSPLEAAMMTITGVQPMNSEDTRALKDATELDKKHQEEGANLYIKDFRRGLQAVKNQDWDNADQYFTNAKSILEVYRYPQERRDQLFSIALQDQTIAERAQWEYYMGRNVPAGKEQGRADAFARLQQRIQGNNQ